jgi:hypothetical protein
MPELHHRLNLRTEFTQTGSDTANNGSTDQESRSKLALDVLNFKGDDAVSRTRRATTVLAGGLMDGMVNGVSHAADNKIATATTVAESFAVGYGLSAVSKMGKFGAPVAAIAGLGMGAAWVYSEFNAGRPQATIGAVSEAYHSGAHLEANRRQVAANGGAILFDATLAGLSGGIGMKAGMNLKPNWHVDALASGKAQFAKTSEFFGNDHLAGLSRSFAGKEAKPSAGAGVFDQVKDIVNTKPKTTGSFADLQAQLKKSQLADDTHLVVAKEKLTTIHQENLALAAKETQLSGKMTRQIQEREALNGPLPERAQLTRAQENLRSAEEVGRTISSKRQEHNRLFEEREHARSLIKEDRTADGRPTAEKIAFDAKNQQFRDAKAAFEEAKTMGGNEAIGRARERVTEAQAALSAAEQAKPVKQAAIEKEIKATEGELIAVREQRQTLAVSAQELVALHQSRMSALEADPSLKIAHEKPVVVKEAVSKPAIAETAKPATVIAEVFAPKPTTTVAAETPAGRNLIKEVPEPPVAAKDVAAKEVAAQPAEPVRVEVAKPLADAPVRPAAEVAAKPAIERLQVSQQLSTAKANAEAVVRSNQLFREIETNRRTISDIDGGTYRAKPGENLAETRTRAEQNAMRAQEQLGSDRAPSYTRALKIVGEYAKAASKELAQIPDAGKRGQVATEAVAQLEGMMNNLPNSYKGYREKLSDLREPGRGTNTGSPERRLSEIQQHLEAKTRLLDDLRNKQLLDVAEQQPILKEILDRQRNGNLPEDGTIVLFGRNGRFINQPNTRSPHFIEVSRLNEHGVGADGAGFNRFTANAADIDGMVILKPIYENGMKVQLPSKGNGKPVFKKMVAEVFGNTPPEILVGDNFVRILERFGPERQRPGS